MKIAKYIEEVINEKGHTKIWVSEKCNIRYKTFVDKLQNDRFTAYELLKIGNLLHIDLNYMKNELRRDERRMEKEKKPVKMVPLDKELIDNILNEDIVVREGKDSMYKDVHIIDSDKIEYRK